MVLCVCFQLDIIANIFSVGQKTTRFDHFLHAIHHRLEQSVDRFGHVLTGGRTRLEVLESAIILQLAIMSQHIHTPDPYLSAS